MSNYLQGRTIHRDVHLTNIAMNYRPEGMIGGEVFPMVPVDKQSNMIKTYTQADLFRRFDTVRARGQEAKVVEYNVGSDQFFCRNYALKGVVTIEDRVNADPIFVRSEENGKVMNVMDSLLLDWDVRVAALAFTTTNVGTSANVASSWTDYTNSTPHRDLWTMMDNVQDITGYRPNHIAFGQAAWKHFRRNDDVIDKTLRTAITGGDRSISQQEAAAFLEVDQVLVGNGYYNTAHEGIAQTLTPIWGPHVLVYYRPSEASTERPSFGYSMRWQAPGIANMGVERHGYDTRRKCEEFEIGYYQDEKITGSTLGALVTNISCSQ